MSDGYVLQCGRVTVAIDYWTAPQASAFFLTHMHADHYHGLHNDWSQGVIYCSELTRLLLQRKWPHLRAKVIPLDEPVTLLLSGHETLSVTAIDANHCPVRKIAQYHTSRFPWSWFHFKPAVARFQGAVMYLFEGCCGRVLHTGDFRCIAAAMHARRVL